MLDYKVQAQRGIMNYRFLEHTADARVECTGATFAELLEAAALALYAVAFRRMEDRSEDRRLISIAAEKPEDVLVRWLQELIYLMEAEHFAVTRFRFMHADANRVEAEVQGYRYRAEDREDEVKAATYHGMKVEQQETGWRAEVIFDL
ncbi:MAG TPA: archease [Candidatus Hydrogenedentes bacterium]|nr:archease [Candidatus Hydrogenedentota bacterium]